MLCARWPVTTVITDWHFDAEEMRPKDLNDLGLSWQKQIEFNHQRFDVFRRSADPKDVREGPDKHDVATRPSGRSRKRAHATGS
jgi:hypothetical protein